MMISGIQSSTRAPTMAIGPQAASRVQPLALARAVGRSPCSLPQRRRPSSGAPLRAPPPPTAPPAAAARPRRPVLCSAQQRPGTVELLLDSVAGKDEVLSAKLEPDVRQRAERAIAARGGRVTIGEPLHAGAEGSPCVFQWRARCKPVRCRVRERTCAASRTPAAHSAPYLPPATAASTPPSPPAPCSPQATSPAPRACGWTRPRPRCARWRRTARPRWR